MTQAESFEYWQRLARAELKAARALLTQDDADLYREVLFHCHLSVELALKSEYIREKDGAAPFTHRLSDLASALDLARESIDYDDLDQLSEYAILARYGDEEWSSHHATKKDAILWLEKTEKILSRILP